MRKEEMETIISYNQADKTAHAIVWDKRLMRLLDRRAQEGEEIKCIYQGEGYREYILPAKRLTVRAKRKLSEEHKEKLRTVLEKNREKKQESGEE